MKVKITHVAALVLAAFVAPAQAQSISDVQSYLSRNAAQQEIYLTRQLAAQQSLVAECRPGADASSFRPDFNAWLAANPRFLNRSAQLAVTAALIDFCEKPN